jgi:hypothetical protein
MPRPNEFTWTTKDRIKSHEEYLRGSRSQPIAATLNWATATHKEDEEVQDVLDPDVKFPDTLVDDPQDSDDAVDHSDPTKTHDTSAGFALATNWDALLDTAGVPTDGTPPDPLAAQQQQQQLEEQIARKAQMMSQDTGGSQPGGAQPGVTTPQMPAPVSPAEQDRANQKRRAGRGVEGTCPNGSPMPATGCGACAEQCEGRIVAQRVVEGTCPNGSPMPATGCGDCSEACEGRITARTCPKGSPMTATGCGDCDCDESGDGPTNPMDPGNKYDWDSFSITPRL